MGGSALASQMGTTKEVGGEDDSSGQVESVHAILQLRSKGGRRAGGERQPRHHYAREHVTGAGDAGGSYAHTDECATRRVGGGWF